MPTYDFKCPECGHKFENFQPVSQPDANCPICGGLSQRQISAGAGLLFKGSGFYITDYRSNEYKKKQHQERTSEAGPPEKAKEAKTTSKQEA